MLRHTLSGAVAIAIFAAPALALAAPQAAEEAGAAAATPCVCGCPQGKKAGVQAPRPVEEEYWYQLMTKGY